MELLLIFDINGMMRKFKIIGRYHMQILDKDPVDYIVIMDMGFMWPLAGLTRQALSLIRWKQLHMVR